MADVIGPNSYVPGQVRTYNGPEFCDDCDKPATFMMIGETDSFGSEVMHLCAEHMAERQKVVHEYQQQPTTCDFCGKSTTDCEPYRDPEESRGPVYTVCEACRVATSERFAKAMVEPDEEDPTALLDDDDDLLPPLDDEPEDD